MWVSWKRGGERKIKSIPALDGGQVILGRAPEHDIGRSLICPNPLTTITNTVIIIIIVSIIINIIILIIVIIIIRAWYWETSGIFSPLRLTKMAEYKKLQQGKFDEKKQEIDWERRNTIRMPLRVRTEPRSNFKKCLGKFWFPGTPNCKKSLIQMHTRHDVTMFCTWEDEREEKNKLMTDWKAELLSIRKVASK